MTDDSCAAECEVDRSRAIVRNTTLQAAAHIVGLALSVGGVAVATRYLGVRGYGVFSLLAVLLTVPISVVNGGLDPLAVRLFAVDGDPGGVLLRNLLGLKLAVALGFTGAATAVSWFVPLPLALRLAVSAFGVVLVASGLQGTLLAVEQAGLRFRLPVLVDVGTRLLSVSGLALLALAFHSHAASAKVALCVAVSAGASLLWLAFSFVRLRRRVSVGLALEREVWWRLARDAAPLGLISLLGLVNYRLDVVVLGALAGTEAVGVYAVATRFVDAVLPLASFFVAASFPVLAATAAAAPDRRPAQVQRAAQFLALVSIPITLGGWVSAPELVHVIAGPHYTAAVVPLRLLLLSLPFSYMSTFLLFVVIAANRQHRVLWLLVTSIALNLGLNAGLVPLYSYVAPAVATLASEVFGTAALLVIVRRMLGIRIRPRPILKTLLAGGAMFAVALALARIDGLIAAAVSAGVYLGAVFALRVVRLPDLKLLAGRAA